MKKITFNRNFTSPVFGNVWIGRTIEVKPKDAEKYVNMGWADMVMERKIEETKKIYAEKTENQEMKEEVDGNSKPKRSKKSSKSRSK